MVDSGKRAEMMEAFIAQAQEVLNGSDSMPVHEQGDDFKTQLEFKGDSPVMVNKINCDGLMVDDWKKATADWLNLMIKLAPSNAKFTDMGKDGDCQCVFQKINAGVPLVADRNMIVTYYSKASGDDHIFLISSQGNEHLREKVAANVASGDVWASLDFNYMHFTPLYDSCGDVCGTEITQALRTNPNGSIIDALKKKMVGYQSKTLLNVAKELKK